MLSLWSDVNIFKPPSQSGPINGYFEAQGFFRLSTWIICSSLVTENHQRTDVYFPVHTW